eukprot:g9026.t1
MIQFILSQVPADPQLDKNLKFGARHPLHVAFQVGSPSIVLRVRRWMLQSNVTETDLALSSKCKGAPLKYGIDGRRMKLQDLILCADTTALSLRVFMSDCPRAVPLFLKRLQKLSRVNRVLEEANITSRDVGRLLEQCSPAALSILEACTVVPAYPHEYPLPSEQGWLRLFLPPSGGIADAEICVCLIPDLLTPDVFAALASAETDLNVFANRTVAYFQAENASDWLSALVLTYFWINPRCRLVLVLTILISWLRLTRVAGCCAPIGRELVPFTRLFWGLGPVLYIAYIAFGAYSHAFFSLQVHRKVLPLEGDGSIVVLPMRLRRGDPNGDSSRAWFSVHLGKQAPKQPPSRPEIFESEGTPAPPGDPLAMERCTELRVAPECPGVKDDSWHQLTRAAPRCQCWDLRFCWRLPWRSLEQWLREAQGTDRRVAWGMSAVGRAPEPYRPTGSTHSETDYASWRDARVER